GAAIARHAEIPTLSFTGSTVAGADIAKNAAPLFKKVALEMGGKNPNVVFNDADLDEAVAASLRASFTNQGEICLSGSRIFVEPTVITNLGVESRVNREEIFGPVVTITPFKDEDQVVAWANGTDYGLAAMVWTESLPRAHRLAERIASGTIWINCWLLCDLRVPFGGMKRSGLGREG